MKREIIEQRKFLAWLEKNGYQGVCIQTKGPYGKVGFNDVIAAGPFALIVWFEFKRETGETSAIQRYRHRKLKKLGHSCNVVYTSAQAEKIFKETVLQAQTLSRNVHPTRPRKPCVWISIAARSRKDKHHSFYLLNSPPPWVS